MKTATHIILSALLLIAPRLPLCAQVTDTPLNLTVIGGRPFGISSPSHNVVFTGVHRDNLNCKTFCRSMDAGASWTTVEIPEAVARSCVSTHAVNDSTIFVAMTDLVGNQGGAVWRSTDSGDNWEQLTTTEFANGFLDFVYFTTPDSGMALGDPNNGYFEIHTTTDGGSTWTRTPQADIPALVNNEYGTVNDFSAVGPHIWFDTTQGRIIKSDDLGLHWTLCAIPAGVSYPNVTFADALHGASHNPNSSADAYITSDGGATWTPQAINPSLQVSYICAVPGVEGTFVFNAQAPARVCVTTDNFQTYVTLASTTGYAYGFEEVHMFDASIGWTPKTENFQSHAMYKVENTLTGISDAHAESPIALQIFPNPASFGATLVTVDLNGANSGQLELTDLQGRTVRSISLQGTQGKSAHILDLQGVPAGSYLLTLKTNLTHISTRLVVQ